MDDKKSGLSFGFKKKQDSIQLGKSIVSEDVVKEDTETDYVLSLEGKEVKSTKSSNKSSKPDYVIPLIKRNLWRRGDKKLESILSDKNDETAPTSLDEQAAKEILQDTARYNEEWDERGKEDTKLAIPLLVQNQIPEGFESDEKLDVVLRPDEPNDADYDQIPIEHFGLAMLRGMGWSKDKGIGKNSKVVIPIEAHIRPKGLGLGADRNNSGADKKVNSDNGHDNGIELIFKKNAYCVVTAGKDSDMYGTIEGIDEDNSRVMLKLSLSGKVVNILQSSVRVVSKPEFDKYSKYLNKQKVDEYKANETKIQENGGDKKSYESKSNSQKEKRRHNLYDGDSDVDDSKSKKLKQDEKQSRDYRESQQKQRNRDDRHSKHKVNSNSDTNCDHYEPEQAKNTGRARDVSWLRNDLRVRVVDKGLNRGKYYKEKVVIIDVPYPGKCVLKTDDGKLIENVTQSSLETVVPRLENAFIAIVGGSHRGQIGQIMKRDKDQCLALVQLLSDRDVVLRLQYDDICEFTGDVQNLEDY